MKSNRNYDPANQGSDGYLMLRRLQYAVLVGVLFILVYALQFVKWGSLASVIGVGILTAGASVLAGFLVGFVFGIPRTSKDGVGSASSPQARRSIGGGSREGPCKGGLRCGRAQQ